jgi:hypothetical protein
MAFLKAFNRRIFLSLAKVFAIGLIPFLIAIIILYIPFPRQIGLSLKYDFTTVIIALFILFLLVYSLPGWYGKIFGLGFTLLIFILPLSGLWTSGYMESYIIRGILPWSDADGYYTDARYLLNGGLFDNYQGRPLFPGMLSALLGITGRNLQITLVIIVMITAIACYLATREVQRTHGTLAGAVVIVILFFFYRRFIGTTMTENLGLALGAIGFALIWRGISKNNQLNVFAGIFFTALAMNARPAALLVVPALVIWGSFAFRGQKRFSLPFFGVSVLVVVIVFLINLGVVKALSQPRREAFSNYTNIFFQMVTTGENSDYINQRYSEIKALPESERPAQMYKLAIDIIRQNPRNFIDKTLQAYKDFFSIHSGIFGFMHGENETANSFVHVFLYLFCILAIIISGIYIFESSHSLIIAVLIGTLLSMPFAPPVYADLMRIYAATSPYFGLLPALGISFLASKIKMAKPLQIKRDVIYQKSSLVFGLSLAVFVLIGPLFVKLLSHKPLQITTSCPADSVALFVQTNPGSYLNVRDSDKLKKTWLPEIRTVDFVAGKNYDFWATDVLDLLAKFTPDTSLYDVLDLKTGRSIWLVSETGLLPTGNNNVSLCAEKIMENSRKSEIFYRVESVNFMSKP